MSDKVNLVESNLTKTDILRALAVNLQQLSFEVDSDEPVYIADATPTKDGVVVECTNGTTIELTLASVRH